VLVLWTVWTQEAWLLAVVPIMWLHQLCWPPLLRASIFSTAIVCTPAQVRPSNHLDPLQFTWCQNLQSGEGSNRPWILPSKLFSKFVISQIYLKVWVSVLFRSLASPDDNSYIFGLFDQQAARTKVLAYCVSFSSSHFCHHFKNQSQTKWKINPNS
jgi:hypothetical protein